MGNQRFVLVAVNYFTKWAETEALANIRDVDVKKFVWKNIITRFGVRDSLISDNGLQFDSLAFREFCSNLGIKNRYSSPAYSQSNGQAEAVNKVIVNGLKRRLEGAKGNWAEELSNVFWVYRITPRRCTGETHSLSRTGRRPLYQPRSICVVREFQNSTLPRMTVS